MKGFKAHQSALETKVNGPWTAECQEKQLTAVSMYREIKEVTIKSLVNVSFYLWFFSPQKN